jgi:hypothetical protein
MKLKVLIILFASNLIFGQAEYLSIDHRIYPFLERMQILNIIDNYDLIHKPITRSNAVLFINNVLGQKSKLDKSDLMLLELLKKEFQFDIDGTTQNLSGLFQGTSYNIFDENERFVYFYSEKEKGSLFVNTIWEAKSLSTDKYSDLSPSLLGNLTGIFRGTILKKFGFHLEGSNGNIFSNKRTAQTESILANHYKLNESSEQTFFDDTRGHLSLDFDNVKFKIGREFVNVGYGINKPIIDVFSPKFDHASLSIRLGKFSFDYLHGKLLGNKSFFSDSITGGIQRIEEKYFGYHRIGISVSRDFHFGFGELIVYSNRPPDLSYINPFNFYKSVEHASQDRDNSLLFFDISNNSIDGLHVYSTLLMDDIDYAKLGSGWWGNQLLYQFGISSYNFYRFIPIDFHIEYMRIDPYVFSHRLISNNYSNYYNPLGTQLQPNSSNISLTMNYRFTHNLDFALNMGYSVHGANPIDSLNNVLKNVGGDINLGHRTFDSPSVFFLDGVKEYSRKISFQFNYEYRRGVDIQFGGDYFSINKQLSNNEKYWSLRFLLKLII